MRLFLLTFFAVYGGVHVYTFLKARHSISFGTALAFGLALFFIAMVVAPILMHVAERLGLGTAAKILANSGYLWMGFLFLFFSASVTLDLYRLVIFTAGAVFHGDLTPLAVSSRTAFFVAIGWGVITGTYGLFEARNVVTELVVIKTAKLPAHVKKFVIVQISDVHLGEMVRQDRLKTMVELVKSAHPDLLVSTGDLVDGPVDTVPGLAEFLQSISPPYGKFAITGNHEIYAGLQQSISFTERAGFTLLRGTAVNAAGIVTIAGVDDPAVGSTPYSGHDAEEAVLRGLPEHRFRLFLKHRPKVEPESLGLFDLQLSGHVHKGQIFPFNLLTYIFYPVRAGFSIYPQSSLLYVSRGTGTWGPPIRFLAPPEVTVIELVNSNCR